MAERKPFVWGASGVELLQTGDSLAGMSFGAMELLQSVTISSPVVSVDFTGVDGTYFEYLLKYHGVCAESSTYLLCQVQVGGSWVTSGYIGFTERATGYPVVGEVDNTARCCGLQIGTSAYYIEGNLSVKKLDATNTAKLIRCTYGYYAGIYTKHYQYNNYSAVTGLRFIPEASVNLTAGTFKLYGLK